MNKIICDKCGKLINVSDEFFENYICQETPQFICSECQGHLVVEFDKQQAELCGNVQDTRSHNVGNSDYSKHKIQPWDIWIEYKLNPFDADIVKRVLRHKKGDTRKMDYEKIIHICQERIRQIESGEDPYNDL